MPDVCSLTTKEFTTRLFLYPSLSGSTEYTNLEVELTTNPPFSNYVFRSRRESVWIPFLAPLADYLSCYCQIVERRVDTLRQHHIKPYRWFDPYWVSEASTQFQLMPSVLSVKCGGTTIDSKTLEAEIYLEVFVRVERILEPVLLDSSIGMQGTINLTNLQEFSRDLSEWLSTH